MAEINEQLPEERDDVKEKHIPGISSDRVSYLNGLYIVLGVILCVLSSLPFTLVPQNNFIECWQRRTDISSIAGALVDYLFGYSFLWTLHLMFECKLLLKLNHVMNLQVFVRFYLAKLISYAVVPNLIAYLIWNIGLGYDSVMPMNGFFKLIGFPIPYIAVWFQYPKEFRYKNRGRRKFKAYFYYKLWRNATIVLILVTKLIAGSLPSEFQLIMAVLLPITREIDYRVTTKILSKPTGFLDDNSKTSIAVTVNTTYAESLAMILGTTATRVTSFCILAVDFMLNLKSAYMIMRLNAKINPDLIENQKKLIEVKHELRKLSLVEIIEIMVPLCYIFTFLIAYYGPNAELLGNVRSNYWQYKPVEDVGKLVLTIFCMFLVDISSGIFAGLLLSTSSIDLLREGCAVLKTHWPIITLTSACGSYIVSFKTIMSKSRV